MRSGDPVVGLSLIKLLIDADDSCTLLELVLDKLNVSVSKCVDCIP